MDEFSQIGIGGIFAILVIREVLDHLRRKKDETGDAGEKSVEFWQSQFRDIVEGEVKKGLEAASGQMRELRNEQARIRESVQKNTDLLQQITHRLEWRQAPRH